VQAISGCNSSNNGNDVELRVGALFLYNLRKLEDIISINGWGKGRREKFPALIMHHNSMHNKSSHSSVLQKRICIHFKDKKYLTLFVIAFE
jgi:hypothetical protein